MTPVFNEINTVINAAIKKGVTPGDLITALSSGLVGVINCLKTTPEIKTQLAKEAANLIYKEAK